MIDWLKENKRFLKIRAIEKELGCPDTLQKVLQGKQGLPEKWEKPLSDFIKRLCRSGSAKK